MGEIIEFPDRMSTASYQGVNAEPAQVIILPVLRIDRPISTAERMRDLRVEVLDEKPADIGIPYASDPTNPWRT